MNKRQIKKRCSIINKRCEFFKLHMIVCGRRNGKTQMLTQIIKACYSKKYGLFKNLKKIYKKVFISADLSNGKDMSVYTTYKLDKDVKKIIKTEIIN